MKTRYRKVSIQSFSDKKTECNKAPKPVDPQSPAERPVGWDHQGNEVEKQVTLQAKILYTIPTAKCQKISEDIIISIQIPDAGIFYGWSEQIIAAGEILLYILIIVLNVIVVINIMQIQPSSFSTRCSLLRIVAILSQVRCLQSTTWRLCRCRWC